MTVFLEHLQPSHLLCVVSTLLLLLFILFENLEFRNIFNGTLCTVYDVQYTRLRIVKQYHEVKPRFPHHILNVELFETNQSIVV